MPDSLVFGQNNPALASYFRKPLLVFGISAEMIVVDFDLKSDRTQCRGDDLLAKRAVEKNDKRVRQLQAKVHNGWLLLCPTVFDHNQCRAVQ
jgi:hypothetical protein